MDWLNYHHLHYFWVVAREGTIARACDQLHLTQPAISKQLRQLEHSFGEKLFKRVGRNLALTETGQEVFRYAEEIFSLGQELIETFEGKPTRRPVRLSVGVADVLPKAITFRLLEPALHLPEPVQLYCDERGLVELLTELARHRLDLVLSDSPMGPEANVRAYNHLLGECSVSIIGSNVLARKFRRGFPYSLDNAPLLLPTQKSMLRHSLDQWFDSRSIRPDLRGEFDDSALMKVFGQSGLGLLPVPTVVEKEACRQYRLQHVGRLDAVWERYYAISVERRLRHPAVKAITEAAHNTLFKES
jgi:LysR family transcriptional activator of nhaA